MGLEQAKTVAGPADPILVPAVAPDFVDYQAGLCMEIAGIGAPESVCGPEAQRTVIKVSGWDAIVVGAGPTGSTVAILLWLAGHRGPGRRRARRGFRARQ